MSFQRILVAVDKGPVAAHAIEVALDLAAALQAQAGVVHVATPPVMYGNDAGIPRSELMEMAREEGIALLAQLRQNPAFPPFAHEFLEGGDPATEIVKAARASRASSSAASPNRSYGTLPAPCSWCARKPERPAHRSREHPARPL
jgi:nucleotide-binding universal stress UspA family protein